MKDLLCVFFSEGAPAGARHTGGYFKEENKIHIKPISFIKKNTTFS